MNIHNLLSTNKFKYYPVFNFNNLVANGSLLENLEKGSKKRFPICSIWAIWEREIHTLLNYED